jgi:hypothetical protein
MNTNWTQLANDITQRRNIEVTAMNTRRNKQLPSSGSKNRSSNSSACYMSGRQSFGDTQCLHTQDEIRVTNTAVLGNRAVRWAERFVEHGKYSLSISRVGVFQLDRAVTRKIQIRICTKAKTSTHIYQQA